MNALKQNDNLEMPSSSTLSPPFPAAKEMIIPESFSSKRIMRPESSPTPPNTPPGPHQTARPSPPPPEYCLYSSLILSSITGSTSSTSPCHGKISSSLASSSLAHHLCNRFGNRIDLKRPLVPPPPSPLNTFPTKEALAYLHTDDMRQSYDE